jgi:hypothetical protein
MKTTLEVVNFSKENIGQDMALYKKIENKQKNML